MCGKENEQEMAAKYGVCTNCGADLRAAQEAPVQETAMPAGGPPPAYGYQGPPRYQPPPGGQPYPPPGFPGGYMPPSNHPGLYERPEEPPRLDLGTLPRVLFAPREAFYDLYHHTSAAQGWMLVVLFSVLGSVIGYVVSFALGLGADVEGAQPITGVGAVVSIVGIIINVLISLFIFWVATSLVFWLIKSGASPLRPNKDKTFGLVGYAKFPAFIMGLVLSISMSAWLAANPDAFDIDTTGADPLAGFDQLLGYYALCTVITVIQFIWALVVHSHAASVANDTRLGPAIIFTFLAWFIAFWILFAVSIVIGLLIAGIVLI